MKKHSKIKKETKTRSHKKPVSAPVEAVAVPKAISEQKTSIEQKELAEQGYSIEKKDVAEQKEDSEKEKNKESQEMDFSEEKAPKIPWTYFGLGEERDYFIDNLTMLVESGMGLLNALDSLRLSVRTERMRQVIDVLKYEVISGSTLWRALEELELFSGQIVALIRIGEESGRLTENLKVIALQQQKERLFKSKLRSAMMYPVFVLALAVMMGLGIAWFILPKLSLVFSQMKINLPLITRVLIGFGTFLSHYGVIVLPAFAFVVMIISYFVFFFSKTKFIGQFLFYHFPGIGKLIRETELSRFGYILGTLLDAGVPVTESLESLARAESFYSFKKLYLSLKASIEDGNSLQKSFEENKSISSVIPVPIQQMIVAGEKSGRLPEVLLNIGNNYESRLDDTTKNLTVILEPILLVIVWLMVLSVALAIILPIYSLIGEFKY